MVENVRGPVPSQMLTNACRNVSECFPDVAGITSCTSKLKYDTRTEMERHGILHTEHVTEFERRESELKFQIEAKLFNMFTQSSLSYGRKGTYVR